MTSPLFHDLVIQHFADGGTAVFSGDAAPGNDGRHVLIPRFVAGHIQLVHREIHAEIDEPIQGAPGFFRPHVHHRGVFKSAAHRFQILSEIRFRILHAGRLLDGAFRSHHHAAAQGRVGFEVVVLMLKDQSGAPGRQSLIGRGKPGPARADDDHVILAVIVHGFVRCQRRDARSAGMGRRALGACRGASAQKARGGNAHGAGGHAFAEIPS